MSIISGKVVTGKVLNMQLYNLALFCLSTEQKVYRSIIQSIYKKKNYTVTVIEQTVLCILYNN